MIANAVDGPIYTHSYPDELNNHNNRIEFHQFGRESIFDKILSKTPLGNVGQLLEYAAYKPPKKYDAFITRGPKAIHTTQRIGQHHIHMFDGTYRGPFFQKDKFDQFHTNGPTKQFILGGIRFCLRTAIQASMHTIDTVVANSEWTADVIKSLFNRRPDEIVYPLMNIDSYSPEHNTKRFGKYYLYLGAIDRHHRTKTVIRAFNQLPHKLIVAGDGAQKEELESIADDNITFYGYVKGEKKHKLLASTKALVNPTDHSFGRVLIESLRSGSPVISTRLGYPRYLLDDGRTGILYDGESASKLISAIRRFEKEGISGSTEELVETTTPFERKKNIDKWKSLVRQD
jgi:glycosyltransferase involved in cell wall biosynthesis